jgi:hypothetical protein
MYVHHVVGTGSYTTSTTNMYNKDNSLKRRVKRGCGGAKKSARSTLTRARTARVARVCSKKPERSGVVRYPQWCCCCCRRWCRWWCRWWWWCCRWWCRWCCWCCWWWSMLQNPKPQNRRTYSPPKHVAIAVVRFLCLLPPHWSWHHHSPGARNHVATCWILHRVSA